jgi:hypothetical protein
LTRANQTASQEWIGENTMENGINEDLKKI